MTSLKKYSTEWVESKKIKLKSRTHQDGECWIWEGPKFSDGYGNCGVGYGQMRAHRASYELFVGPVGKGIFVLHSCDKPLCINPSHLSIGDNKKNVKESLERGLFPLGPNPKKGNKGDRNGMAKLNYYTIELIRKEYIPMVFGFHRLSKKYGISKRQVMRIVKGVSWQVI